jgi:hypothetical protein
MTSTSSPSRSSSPRTYRYNGFLEPDVPAYEALATHTYEMLIDTSAESTSTSLQRILRYLEKDAGSAVGSGSGGS